MTDDFEARTLPLAGGKFATLVRVPAEQARGAILYVHGFADYFFQRHVAEHFTAQGFDFYAVDLRYYGRSLRDGDTPNFVLDITEYFEELDAAVELMREDGHERLTVMAHSTGGLITPLWLDARKDYPVDGLILNSPWFELAEPWVMRTIGTAVIKGVGRIAPKLVIRNGLGGVYGQSIHKNHHGEWEFDLKMKPINAFPVLAGWLRAIRIGHARLQAGLDIQAPVLVLHSSRSWLHAKAWAQDAMTADTVLDVADMIKFAPRLGKRVTVVEIPDGLHDLFLSAEPARTKTLTEIDDWLTRQRS
ncbi:alpha-beta hydrolase superfamily lysophospholipase [Kibdelosporangium banguiense]|uniref:Alpha-beta hydrolase superfamily lysophospholipase n=1 Tax=Kibdelosporangium banguiense TaxID=1365924 RepID=A0ABS4TIM5_9PSEU|nr:alpha/beta hydrolase [Kibdelosporangium banguiense]MBP2323874.1 alpha-beta hydrolase superfamily lysophospholipase [Kibdelosporangium banguiense]